MGATDGMVAKLAADIESKRNFQDQLVEGATREGRDLTPDELDLYTRASDEMAHLDKQLTPLRDGARIAAESLARTAELAEQFAAARNPAKTLARIEYRSAGEYVIDKWRAGTGVVEATERLNLYHRAAQHQTTTDNPGIIPEPVVAGVLDYLDTARPIVATIGPAPVPGGTFRLPRVTQHTQVDIQSAEKGELVSRKMIIERVPVSMATYGGYVNVSRQDIDWSVPSIMDIVIQDLAGQYSMETEQVAAQMLVAETPVVTPPITPTSDAAAVNAAVWAGAAMVYQATGGQGRAVLAVSPDMLGAVGALFPPYAPTNAFGSGFSAGAFTQGPTGSISGITVVMSAQLPAATAIMFSTAGVRAFEQRLGALQVTEPSVLGVQVAYAGYFASVVVAPGSVVSLT